ncbi:MAG: triose-phosphate isomerase [Bacillota bacterium]
MELIIAANWKMHKNAIETVEYCREIKKDEKLFEGVEVIICPPYTALYNASEVLSGSLIKLGAQNMHWEQKGAFTGEISASMLLDLGVEYVIIGHSERRHLLGEDDSWIQRKVKAALDSGLRPILCVGETETEREEGATEKILERQLSGALDDLPPEDIGSGSLIVAYEPVWAIGTGKAASPEDAENAAAFICKTINNLYGERAVENLRIQYGGSVKEDNIESFVVNNSIHGALVGGASLKADTFSALIRAARKAV